VSSTSNVCASSRANGTASITAADGALEQRIKAQAYGLGFDLVGLTTLGPADTTTAFDDWLARGYAGEMHYMSRWATERRDSRLPFPGATSAVVVGMNYGGTEPPGPIARYARGDDYHDVMRDRLRELHRWIEEQAGHTVHGRPYVDTGPVLERDLARRAGLGWFGKNTTLINPALGSFFFIGSLFVEMDLTPDAPFDVSLAGLGQRGEDLAADGGLLGLVARLASRRPPKWRQCRANASRR